MAAHLKARDSEPENQETQRLKHLVAELTLDKQTLQELLRKKL